MASGRLAPVTSPLEVGSRALHASREGGLSSVEWNRHPPPHPSLSRGEGGECGLHRVTPRWEGSSRLTRSVESRFSHRLTIRWRIETLFHTIELQHPCSERAATVAGEAHAKPRRAGTERHRGCAGGRAGWRCADEKARRRGGSVIRRRAAQQEREAAAAARRQREPARCGEIDAAADLADDGAGAAGGAGQRLLHGPQHVAGFRRLDRDQPLGGKAEILEARAIGRAVLGKRHVLGDPHQGARIAPREDERKPGRDGDFRLAGRGDLVERAGRKPAAQRRIEGGNAERHGAMASGSGKLERQRTAQPRQHGMRWGSFAICRSDHCEPILSGSRKETRLVMFMVCSIIPRPASRVKRRGRLPTGCHVRAGFMAPRTDTVGTPTLRPARAEEEAAVVGLWRACGLVVSWNDPVADFRFALGRSNSDILIAADPAGSIVGAAMIGHDGHRGWIYYLAAHPDRRRQGIGTTLAADLEQTILLETELHRYGLFVWQKQTSKMMFGSYPFPGNILENNTIEFIHVYVKPGAPPKFPRAVKAANRLSRTEWLDLTQQVWFMYPQDVKRGGEHPAPFPEKLPARLIRLYSFGACENFAGETVLDPFAGTGTTCVAAKRMGRRYVGIDVDERYLQIAAGRLRKARRSQMPLLVGRPKYPGKEELRAMSAQEAGSNGKAAAGKHKKRTYGRKVGGPIRRFPDERARERERRSGIQE